MTRGERIRLERLSDELAWLADYSEVELKGDIRDAIGRIRFTIYEATQ